MKNTFLYRQLLRISMVVFFAGIFTSCQKGTEGPQGPAGPAGPQGPQGPAASANQQILQIPLTNWGTLSGALPAWSIITNVPAITQDVINNGNIFVYWTQGGDQTLLPFVSGGIDYMYVTGVSNGNGFVQIFVDKTGIYATSPPTYFQPASLKVVISH